MNAYYLGAAKSAPLSSCVAGFAPAELCGTFETGATPADAPASTRTTPPAAAARASTPATARTAPPAAAHVATPATTAAPGGERTRIRQTSHAMGAGFRAAAAFAMIAALAMGSCTRQVGGAGGQGAGVAATGGGGTGASPAAGGQGAPGASPTAGAGPTAGASSAASGRGAADSQADPRLGPALVALQRASADMGATAAAQARARMVASPKDFLDTLDTVLAERALDPDRFARVDKIAPPLPSTFVPNDLVKLDSIVPVARKGLSLRSAAAGALAAMARAAKADGVRLVAGSSYRSWAYQKAVFAREVKSYGEEQAKRESAEPGRSQHQLGTAIDFSPIDDVFGKSPAYAWLVAHARDFGFSQSYPEGLEAVTGYRPESWHWRWIGPAATRLERDYFGGTQQYLIEFLGSY